MVTRFQTTRVASIDIVRGFVMLLMLLDHTRDFFGNEDISALDLSNTNPLLFFTRWVTHLCAPTFILLTGISIYLQKQKKGLSIRWFVFTRGLFLIVLEQTVLRCLGWYFNFDYRYMNAGVLWGIGGAMMLLALFIYIPKSILLLFSLLIIAGNDMLLQMVKVSASQTGYWLWVMFFSGGNIEYLPGFNFYVSYPIIPWFGIMTLGYCLGSYFTDRKIVKFRLYHWGILFVSIFIVLRVFFTYGNPTPWQRYPSSLLTFLSFINLEKYPPSFLYTMLMLSITIFLLITSNKLPPALKNFLKVYGEVPLFFYVSHIVLIHLLAVAIALLRYGRADWLYTGPSIFWDDPLPGHPADYGLSLGWIYTIALVLIIVLYPFCRWYKRFKSRDSSGLLSYI